MSPCRAERLCQAPEVRRPLTLCVAAGRRRPCRRRVRGAQAPAEEGLAKGLYKGFVANIVRSVGGALVLVFYDRAKVYLGIGGGGSE